MHLITVAHPGEALGVIEKFKLTQIKQNLFGNEKIVLLITGEGPFEASVQVAATLPLYPFSKVINLGIAGTLDPKINVGEVVQIRTVYLIHDTKPEFKTFQCADVGLDCITSFQRILDPEKALKLRGLGKIVDRELWGVAFACKSANIPMTAYKVISDQAGTLEACELVKSKVQQFSTILSEKLSEVLAMTSTPQEELPNLKGFHFTFTTGHKFKNLLNKFAIKNNLTAEEALLSLNTQKFLENELSPKERTKLLLEELEGKIDPTKTILLLAEKQLVNSFSEQGLKLQLDPQWENPYLTISMEVSHDEELKEKIKKLETLSIKPFSELMKGNFHVE